MNGLLAGALFGGLLYALSRARSDTPVVHHAPAPDTPEGLTAPTPTLPTVPVVVMVGFNVGWPENVFATLGYMQQNVPPAVTATISKMNELATSGQFLSGARTIITAQPYGYLATALVQWSGTTPPDKTWIRSTVEQLIRARGGNVASHLRDVRVA